MYASQTDNKYVLLFCFDIVVIIVVVIDVVSVIIMRREARYDTIITIKGILFISWWRSSHVIPPPLFITVVILSSSSSSLFFFLPLLRGNILVWHNDHEQVLSLEHIGTIFSYLLNDDDGADVDDKQRKGNHQPTATTHAMSSMMLSSFS